MGNFYIELTQLQEFSEFMKPQENAYSPHFILDLDGTLIDSAPGILSTFEHVLMEHGITPLHPITASLIGPPLLSALREMTGITDETRLRPLADSFRQIYDHEGYRLSIPYPGIEDLLVGWQLRGTPVYIVTNKREIPTKRIIAHLGWDALFQSVYAIDSRTPAYDSKSVAIAALISERKISPERAVYVGDTLADQRAAQANGLAFIGVAWGYGALVGEGVVMDAHTLSGWVPA